MGDRDAAAYSLSRTLNGIKEHTPPYLGRIHNTAEQLPTLIDNQKNALEIIESVVRPGDKTRTCSTSSAQAD